MTSTKELFANGMNYILRDIEDTESIINTSEEYLQNVLAKGLTSQKQYRQVGYIKSEIARAKSKLKEFRKEQKKYEEYFGYTKEDYKKYNLHPATDEEIKADYERDLKEQGYDTVKGKGKYTKEEHDELVRKVNEFNRLNDLPIVSF